jgi:SOS-response transcriptional repressor LexA
MFEPDNGGTGPHLNRYIDVDMTEHQDGCGQKILRLGEIDMAAKFLESERQIASQEQFRNGSIEIPIIPWAITCDWQNFDPYEIGLTKNWISTTKTAHPNAFALVVRDDSMEPGFSVGDIITVDPGRDPVNGSYVVARNRYGVTFKQLVTDDCGVYLKPLNRKYPLREITSAKICILGVVVEKRKGLEA